VTKLRTRIAAAPASMSPPRISFHKPGAPKRGCTLMGEASRACPRKKRTETAIRTQILFRRDWLAVTATVATTAPITTSAQKKGSSKTICMTNNDAPSDQKGKSSLWPLTVSTPTALQGFVQPTALYSKEYFTPIRCLTRSIVSAIAIDSSRGKQRLSPRPARRHRMASSAS